MFNIIAGSLLPHHVRTLSPVPFLRRKSRCIGCILIKNVKNKISSWGEEMSCILSWSLSLSDWLHLFASNLALSFGKYDKLNTDPVFCVRLLISPALSQPSPYRATASLLSTLWFHQSQHYCAWSHFHLVKQGAQGAGSCYPSLSALWKSRVLVSVCTVS